jgi:transglutaminase/protease-like cytokinesis protein 3
MGRWIICVVLVLGAGLAAMPAAADDAVDEFAAADAHALAAPESVATSVSALSAYLVESAQNDRDKARAIFRWITLNIAYDASARADSRDPEIVLSRRRVVCYGYAVLFEALAEASGLEAQVIIGHSKRSAQDLLEEPDARPNHAWNAVRISGEWQLVDSCWGAGYLDEHRRFVPSFNAHYFLTPPEVFVYDHFPLDPGRQLLDPPISEDE